MPSNSDVLLLVGLLFPPLAVSMATYTPAEGGR